MAILLTLKNLTPKNPMLKNWNKDRLGRFLPKLRNNFKERKNFETSQNLATFLIKQIACSALLTYISTRIMFYKERSKVMYSCQFWFLYSRSLICTLLFVQSFLKLKFRFSRSFKEFFFINMFIRKNLHYIYSLLKTMHKQSRNHPYK